MRDDEIVFAGGLLLVADDVQVKCPWPPPNIANAAGFALDAVQLRQQSARRKVRFERDHLVEIRSLLYRADWLGFFNGRDGDDATARDRGERLTSPREVSVAIAEVRAERDVSNVARHYRDASLRLRLTTTSA